jgi:predicted DNA-binding transcriptional regulator AlpA
MMKTNQQPQCVAAHNLPIPTKFLRLPQVLEVFPVSKSTWWAGVKSGKYPKSVKLGCRTTAWSAESIRELLEDVANDTGGVK